MGFLLSVQKIIGVYTGGLVHDRIVNMDLNLVKKLIAAGMSDTEARVYVALLARPSMTIQEVSDMAGLPRSSVMLALERFSTNGVIDEYVHGKRRNFVVRDPKMIEHLVDDKMKDLELQKANLSNLISNIKNSHFLTTAKGAQIEILKGESGFKDIYERTLKLKKGQEILRISVEAKKFFFYPDFLKKYLTEKNKRGIKTRLLIPEGEMAKDVRNRDNFDLRETRFLSKKLYDPNCAITIWSDFVAFTVWDENLETTVIKSKQVVDILRSVFELLWLNAKK